MHWRKIKDRDLCEETRIHRDGKRRPSNTTTEFLLLKRVKHLRSHNVPE
jgi:hypothetical protein